MKGECPYCRKEAEIKSYTESQLDTGIYTYLYENYSRLHAVYQDGRIIVALHKE